MQTKMREINYQLTDILEFSEMGDERNLFDLNTLEKLHLTSKYFEAYRKMNDNNGLKYWKAEHQVVTAFIAELTMKNPVFLRV